MKALELRELNQLVSGAFHYPETQSFLDDFPVWKLTNQDVLHFSHFEKNQLVSHVGARFATMQTNQVEIPIAMVGAVATAESFRGQGLSSSLMRKALQEIDARGSHWTLLWGSEHAFYQKLGFDLQGIQARALVSDVKLATPHSSTKVSKGFTIEIWQALKNRKSGVLLTEADHTWVAEQKTVEWYSTQNPFAYVGYQKGIDLKNIVHEWGGNSEGLHSLFTFILSQNSEAELLGTVDELYSLGIADEQMVTEPLCLARPLHKNMHWHSDFWVSGICAC